MLGCQVHSNHYVLTLRLTLLLLSLFHHILVASLFTLFLGFTHGLLLLHRLLLEGRFELILVFERVSAHLLLFLNALFVATSAFLSHLLFVLHLLLITLRLQLHLILGLALRHFGLILDGFAAFFLLNLNELNFPLLLFVLELKLLRLLLVFRQLERFLGICRAVKNFSGLLSNTNSS